MSKGYCKAGDRALTIIYKSAKKMRKKIEIPIEYMDKRNEQNHLIYGACGGALYQCQK